MWWSARRARLFCRSDPLTNGGGWRGWNAGMIGEELRGRRRWVTWMLLKIPLVFNSLQGSFVCLAHMDQAINFRPLCRNLYPHWQPIAKWCRFFGQVKKKLITTSPSGRTDRVPTRPKFQFSGDNFLEGNPGQKNCQSIGGGGDSQSTLSQGWGETTTQLLSTRKLSQTTQNVLALYLLLN